MKINGQVFYDMQTMERATFGIPDIEILSIEECHIEFLNPVTSMPGNELVLWFVCCVLTDGRIVGTKPTQEQDYTAITAHRLNEKIAVYYGRDN